MLQFLINISQFALQTVIILACLLVIIGFIASLVSRNKSDSDLTVKNLNKKLDQQRSVIKKGLMDKKTFKKWMKEEKAKQKRQKLGNHLYVLDFEGDIKASATEQLRQEISAILMVATSKDQVVVKVESPGGMVHGYGLAASQLQRLKDHGIPLTICVDKIAASGGYMMASIADKIISAPFAIIGSIGVVAALPNFNKLLRKHEVDYLEITAGEYKRTLTPLGEITESGKKKFKEQIEDVHELFKDHVKRFRPQANIEEVATGEYWYGSQAKDLKLIDEIGTSDDYILNARENFTVFEIKSAKKKSFREKLSETISITSQSVIDRLWEKVWTSRFP